MLSWLTGSSPCLDRPGHGTTSVGEENRELEGVPISGACDS
jgi:hypothetical protein